MNKAPRTFDDPFVLEAALEGLEIHKKRIEAQMAEIRTILEKQSSTTGSVSEAKKRDLSPEARKRIAAAQKKRWAEYRKANSGAK
jgi:hypothetical protein